MSDTGPAFPAGRLDGLPAQRTDLAWRRTCLAVATGALAAGKLLEPMLGPSSWALAVAGLVLAGTLAVVAHRRAGHADGGGRLVTACAATVLLLGAGATAFVVSRPFVA